jgi:nicotinamide-nucleotide amidase
VAPDPAAVLVARLTAAGQTVAVAESLTGGLVAAALTEVAGASAVVRGGVLAYATDLKV